MLLFAPGPAFGDDGIATAGEILRVALPVAAGGLSLARKDYDGLLQLGVSEIFAVGTALLLQEIVREQRPDKSDWRSFPSDSAAVAFSAASYVQFRYGWEYGLFAYAAAAFVGYSRVEADKHHWGDVAAGALIGWVASRITTVRYRNIRIGPPPAGARLGLSLSAAW